MLSEEKAKGRLRLKFFPENKYNNAIIYYDVGLLEKWKNWHRTESSGGEWLRQGTIYSMMMNIVEERENLKFKIKSAILKGRVELSRVVDPSRSFAVELSLERLKMVVF